MSAGQTFPAETYEYEDPTTGAYVRRLTDYRCHSYHLYFTNPGWWDEGRRLLFGSDRNNRTNLFSVELATGEITQVTDLGPPDTRFQPACVNPTRAEAYFWHGPELKSVDLHSYQVRVLFTVPEGFLSSMINCTADGALVCAGVFEEMADRIKTPLKYIYAGFRERWEAHPESRIYAVATDGGGAEMMWQEQTWIGHVNTSPTRPNLLTFCHEGPWNLVDNRIWGMDIESGEVWKIRPREQEGEVVGHEYWHADGVHIGYHGAKADGRKLFGRVRYDDTERFEVDFPFETGHIHSNGFAQVVGDAGKDVRIWQWNGEGFDGPRALCEHRSSKHVQQVHVHPRFTPDGKRVLYTSDATGYGNLYVADVPEFDALPPIKD